MTKTEATAEQASVNRLIRTELIERVLHVTLDAPQRRNALSLALLRQLRAALSDATGADAGAVVLSGTGGFSAGADFVDITGTTTDLDYDVALAATTDLIRALPVPVIAAMEGPCVGAAVDLALSTDVRIAATSAWIQVPAVPLGLLYNPTSIAKLHRMLPRVTTTRLLLMAERFTAVEARQAGLVTDVVPDGTAVAAAHARAVAVAKLPREAIRATKGLLAALDDACSDQGNQPAQFDDQHWQNVRLQLLTSPDRQRAVADAHARHHIRTTTEEAP